MRKIDLQKVLKKSGHTKKEIAKYLFPDHLYPQLAINRVIAGDSMLNEVQIGKLALLIGFTIDELFDNGDWKMKTTKGVHHFKNGEYSAELDIETWTTKVFHKKSLCYETVLTKSSITLSEYLNDLDKLILTFK